MSMCSATGLEILIFVSSYERFWMLIQECFLSGVATFFCVKLLAEMRLLVGRRYVTMVSDVGRCVS